MGHPIWPFFDLRVRTPHLTLVPIDDEVSTELALLAAKGIHDPSWMPFGLEWTDVASPQLERNCLQFYWRLRAELSPTSWHLNFGVVVDGRLVGSTALVTSQFPTVRTFETGSWLGREFQGRGIGREMREASLHLGFAALGAQHATTAAFADNGPSLGVTRGLGYAENGASMKPRRGQPAQMLHFSMTRPYWEANRRREDITVEGVEPCLPLLGLV